MCNCVFALTVWGAMGRVYKKHGKAAGPVQIARCFIPIVWRYELERRRANEQNNILQFNPERLRGHEA